MYKGVDRVRMQDRTFCHRSPWRKATLFLAMGVLVLSSACSSKPAGATPAATQAALRGDFTVLSSMEGIVGMRHASGDWSTPEVGDLLQENDSLRTGDQSRALVTFFDGSSLEMEEKTEVQVSELKASAASATKTIVVRQDSGNTVSRVVKLVDSASRYEIQTPVSVAVVRGSIMLVKVAEDGTTEVGNLEGTIAVKSQGVEVRIPEAMTSAVSPGMPPDKPQKRLPFVVPEPLNPAKSEKAAKDGQHTPNPLGLNFGAPGGNGIQSKDGSPGQPASAASASGKGNTGTQEGTGKSQGTGPADKAALKGQNNGANEGNTGGVGPAGNGNGGGNGGNGGGDKGASETKNGNGGADGTRANGNGESEPGSKSGGGSPGGGSPGGGSPGGGSPGGGSPGGGSPGGDSPGGGSPGGDSPGGGSPGGGSPGGGSPGGGSPGGDSPGGGSPGGGSPGGDSPGGGSPGGGSPGGGSPGGGSPGGDSPGGGSPGGDSPGGGSPGGDSPGGGSPGGGSPGGGSPGDGSPGGGSPGGGSSGGDSPGGGSPGGDSPGGGSPGGGSPGGDSPGGGGGGKR